MTNCPSTTSTSSTLNPSSSTSTSSTLNPSSTTSTTTVVGGTTGLLQLLANSGPLDARAMLIYNNTKDAFEHKLVLLRRKKASIELKIHMLEDFSIYRTGKIYNPVTWANKRITLEFSLEEVVDDLATVEALYAEYFLTDGITTISSTTLAHTSSTSSSSSSSTTMAPNTVNFTAVLNGAKEVPPVTTNAAANANLVYNTVTKVFVLNVAYTGITPISAHIHKGAVGVDGPIVFPIVDLTSPMVLTSVPLTAAQEADLYAGLYYVNLHTSLYPDGEIRGQLVH